MNFLFVVPARKGSSFHGKNFFPLQGIPLINYTLKEGLKTDLNKRIIVTTNDHYIKAEVEQFKDVEIHHRDESLSRWDVTLDELITKIYYEFPGYDYYVTLQPTSPLRTAQHIEEACSQIIKEDGDSLVSVKPEFKSIWRKGETFADPIVERLKNRQEETPTYVSNGAIFISSGEGIARFHKRLFRKISLYVMREQDSIEIHDKQDIELAEYYLSKRDEINYQV